MITAVCFSKHIISSYNRIHIIVYLLKSGLMQIFSFKNIESCTSMITNLAIVVGSVEEQYGYNSCCHKVHVPFWNCVFKPVFTNFRVRCYFSYKGMELN